jgi:tetratricopeptide (TPR) repeat protein
MGADVERPGRAWWLDRYGWVVVIAGGLLAYSNSFEGQLYLDDFSVVRVAVESEKEPGALVPHPLTGRWLGTWMFTAGVAVFGPTLAGFHTGNLVIHILAGVTLWALVARTLRFPRFENRFENRAGLLATAVAGLWVVHPLTTAAVTYLSQRFESLMGLFVLVSFWAFARGAAAPAGRVRAWWFGASVAAAYAATASKESAVVLPFVLAIYDRLFLAGSWRGVGRRWPLYLALVAVQAAALPIVRTTLLAAGSPDPAPQAEEPMLLSGIKGFTRSEKPFVSAGFGTTGLTPWLYLRSQPEVILHYLRLVVVPHPLVFDYNWPVATDPEHIWPPGLVILVLLGATAWAVARGAAGGFLGAWFFGFLAVSSSFVPIADLAFEHRMYLPLAACVAALVLGADAALDRLAARGGWRVGWVKVLAAGAAGAALTTLTVERNDDFCDYERMYRALLAQVPDHARAWNNLGTKYIELNRPADALEAYRAAIRYPNPRMADAQQTVWINLIQITRMTKGPSAETVQLVSAFAAAEPDNPSRRFLLANARFEARDLPGAIADYRAAIDLATRQGFPLREPMVFGFYAQALSDSGHPEEAVPIYYRALECPKPPAMLRVQLGQVLTRLGRYAEAEAQFRAASEQAPKAPFAPYNMGVLLLHQGKPADALPWLRDAVQRDRKYPLAVLGLAQALFESGQAPEGRQKFAEALQVAPEWPQEVGNMAWRLATDPDPRARYGTESLRLARLLVDGVGDNNPGALDVLAAALAEVGQFEEAERTARRAAELARTSSRPEVAARAAEYEARRRLYAQSQPYRAAPGPTPK